VSAEVNGFISKIDVVAGTAGGEDRAHIRDLREKCEDWDQLDQLSICTVIVPTQNGHAVFGLEGET